MTAVTSTPAAVSRSPGPGGLVPPDGPRHDRGDRAGQTRVVLLVVPPQAPPAAVGVAMAMAADAAGSAGPADLLAAAGIGEDPAPVSP